MNCYVPYDFLPVGGANEVGKEGDDAQHVVVVHGVVEHVVHVIGSLHWDFSS